MKIVVIGGIGHIGYALNVIKKNPKMLKLCGFASAVQGDIPDGTVKKLSSEFNVKVFEDWRDMLDAVKPDVAVIATRFDMNGVISLECLNRCISCFTEKKRSAVFNIFLECFYTFFRKNILLVLARYGVDDKYFIFV